MDLKIVSFDGNTTINDETTYKTTFPIKGGANVFESVKLKVRYHTSVGGRANLSSVSSNAWKIRLRTNLLGEPATPFDNRDVLAGVFNVTDVSGTLKTLIISDSDDSDKQWQVDCIVTSFKWNKLKDGGYADITLSVSDPIWKAVSQTSDTWNITASGDTDAITAGGNVDTPLYIEIKPTGNRSGAGMIYRRFVDLRNTMTRRHFRGAVNLANSEASNGLDTATLTTAKMQADGDDLQIKVDGKHRDRWLQGMDTGSTEIWINIHLPPKRTGTLKTAIAGSGSISTINLKRTKANKRMLSRMPSRGQVIIGSEYFKYKGKNVNEYQFTTVKRNAFGSSQGAHSAGDTVTHIPHRIWLLYGDNTAIDENSPDADDTKAIFRLDSENDRLDFDEFNTEAGTRANEWTGELFYIRPVGRKATGDPSDCTLYTRDAEGNSEVPRWIDPSTYLCMQLRNIYNGSNYVRTRCVLRWDFYHPVGIDVVTITGRIYSKLKANWPKVELKYSKNGQDWTRKWLEPAPASNATWADHSKNASAESLGGTFRHVRLTMRGVLPAGSVEHQALVEYSDIELSLVGGNAPSVSIGSELTSQYEFKNAVLKNDTTGFQCRLKNGLVIAVNESIVIDTENRDMHLLETGENLREYLETDTIRSNWLDAQGGISNTFSYTDVGTGNVTVTRKWYDRNN